MFLTQIKGIICGTPRVGVAVANHSLLYTYFPTERQRKKYFKSIARALIDFVELNPTSPIHLLVESLNSKKTLPLETLPVTLRNMGEYLHCVPLDAGISSVTWSPVVQGIEALFRRLVLILGTLDEPDYLLNIMVAVLKVPCVPKVTKSPSHFHVRPKHKLFPFYVPPRPFSIHSAKC